MGLMGEYLRKWPVPLQTLRVTVGQAIVENGRNQRWRIRPRPPAPRRDQQPVDPRPAPADRATPSIRWWVATPLRLLEGDVDRRDRRGRDQHDVAFHGATSSAGTDRFLSDETVGARYQRRDGVPGQDPEAVAEHIA